MAEITKWVKKIWKNRTTEFPTRRTLMKEDGSSEIVTVTRNEGTVSEEGDAFDADTMNNLEERIDAGFTEVNGKLSNISAKIAEVTINVDAKEKTQIINALNTYNPQIPSGICIVNFKPDSDRNYYSGVITQKINDTYGLGIVFSYYNNSTVWIRLQNRVWKDT